MTTLGRRLGGLSFALGADPIDVLDDLWLLSRGRIVEQESSVEPTSEPSEPSASPSAGPQPTAGGAPSTFEERVGVGSGTSSPLGRSVALPRARSLPGGRSYLRALRPLRLAVRSRRPATLDEQRTAEAIASTGVWEPVLRSDTEEGRELAVVVDTDGAWPLLAPAVRSFVQILERLGPFRTMRRFHLGVRGDATILATGLEPGAGRPVAPSAFRDPCGRTLTLVITDASGRAWRQGTAARLLAAMGRGVSIVQTLPPEHWSRTELGRAPTAAELFLLDDKEWEELAVTSPIPVASVLPRILERWARTVDRREPANHAVRLPRAAPEPNEARPNGKPEARITEFLANASPHAARLAILCSMVPPPIRPEHIGVVREAMVPGATIAHEAEFFLGGLLETVEGGFAFPDEVGAALRRRGTPSELDTLVAKWLEGNWLRREEFYAALVASARADGSIEGAFAAVSRSRLRDEVADEDVSLRASARSPEREAQSDGAGDSGSAIAERKQIFISYSHADSEMVEEIRGALEGLRLNDGIDIIDAVRVGLGEYQDCLLSALANADLVIPCLSQHYFSSARCDVEAEQALSSDAIVAPCIVSPCDIRHPGIRKRQFAVGGRPFSEAWPDRSTRERWLFELVEEVRLALQPLVVRPPDPLDAIDRKLDSVGVRRAEFGHREDALRAVEEAVAPRDREIARRRAAAEIHHLDPELSRYLANIFNADPDPVRIAECLLLCDLEELLDVIHRLNLHVRGQRRVRIAEVRRILCKVFDYTLPYARSLEGDVQKVRDALDGQEAGGHVDLRLDGPAMLEVVMARYERRPTHFLVPLQGLPHGRTALWPPVLFDTEVPIFLPDEAVVFELSRKLFHDLGLGGFGMVKELSDAIFWIEGILQDAADPDSGDPSWYLVYDEVTERPPMGHDDAWDFLWRIVHRYIPSLPVVRLRPLHNPIARMLTLELKRMHSA